MSLKLSLELFEPKRRKGECAALMSCTSHKETESRNALPFQVASPLTSSQTRNLSVEPVFHLIGLMGWPSRADR